jgi:hypothetical protein
LVKNLHNHQPVAKRGQVKVDSGSIDDFGKRLDNSINTMVFGTLQGHHPKRGQTAKKKYEDLKKGLVGSMLNVKGKGCACLQKIAVEQTRLKIPLLLI